MIEHDDYNGMAITRETARTLIDLIKEDKRKNPEAYEEKAELESEGETE